VGLLYGLSNVSRSGGFGRADVLVPVLAGAALTVGFAVRSARAGAGALVDVRLLRHRPVASSSALLFLSGAALYGAMLLLPLYWQQARGAGPLTAGLLLAPQGIGTLISRPMTGRYTDTLGGRAVALVGFLIVGIATVPFALAGPHTSAWLLMAALVVRGIGLGAVTVPVMAVAFVGLDRADVPHASILTRIAQQVGGSFGTAVLAVILQGALHTAGPEPTAPTTAFDRTFWWSIAFTAVAVPVTLLLPGRPAAPAAPEPQAHRVHRHAHGGGQPSSSSGSAHTRLRPACLAAYTSSSARASRPLGMISALVAVIPMLTVTVRSLASTCHGYAAISRRSVSRWGAAAFGPIPGRISRNSSPPVRAANPGKSVVEGGTAAASRRARMTRT
jgi:MFS family permease